MNIKKLNRNGKNTGKNIKHLPLPIIVKNQKVIY